MFLNYFDILILKIIFFLKNYSPFIAHNNIWLGGLNKIINCKHHQLLDPRLLHKSFRKTGCQLAHANVPASVPINTSICNRLVISFTLSHLFWGVFSILTREFRESLYLVERFTLLLAWNDFFFLHNLAIH